MEIKVKLSAEGEKNMQDWKEYVLDGGCDIFRSRHYCAYWAFPVAFMKGKGWLVSEMADGSGYSRPDQEQEAIRAWKDNLPLPKGYYAFGAKEADHAFGVGVVYKGERWYDKGDANDYDRVVQLALLGEMRYG